MVAEGEGRLPEKLEVNIEIDGEQRTLRLAGFTSEYNLHRHYMTHVARVNRAQAGESRDPEQWVKVWPKGACLPVSLPERRQETTGRLRETLRPCDLAVAATSSEDICQVCGGEWRTIQAVSSAFVNELRAYSDVAEQTVKDGVHGDNAGPPRYFFTRDLQQLEDLKLLPDGSIEAPASTHLVLYVMSDQRVFVMASVRPGDTVRVVTCYRPSHGERLKPLSRAKYDFQMRRRAALSSGALVPSRPAVEPTASETVRG